MKKKNNWFMGGSILAILLLFVALVFLTKYQEKQLESVFPTPEQYGELVVEGETADFDYETQPSLGDENAPVKVVQFGDYKCSHCFSWKGTAFTELNEEYIQNGDVEFYFLNKQFLAMDSILAGIAAEAVFHQDEASFWEFHDALYKTNEMVSAGGWGTRDRLMSIAKESITSESFDFELLEKDITEFTYMNEVKRDDEIAEHFGVSGTPTVFINGQLVSSNYEAMKQAIENELEAAKVEEKEENE